MCRRQVHRMIVIPHGAHGLGVVKGPTLPALEPRHAVRKVVIAPLARRDEEVGVAVGVGWPVPAVHVERHLVRKIVDHPHDGRLADPKAKHRRQATGKQGAIGHAAGIAPKIRCRDLHRARQKLIRPRHVVHLVVLYREAVPVGGMVRPFGSHAVEHTTDRGGVLGREGAGRHRRQPLRKDDWIDPPRDLVILEGVRDRAEIDRHRRVGKLERRERGDGGDGMDGRGTDDGGGSGRPLHERATTGTTSPAGRRSTTGTRHEDPSQEEDPFDLCRKDGSCIGKR